MSDDSLLHQVTKMGKSRYETLRVSSVSQIELDNPDLIRKMPTERRLLMMVFLLALKDCATTLDFMPGPFTSEESEDFVGQIGLKVFYEVNGEYIALVPPPPSWKKFVTRELQRIAGLSTWRRIVGDVLRRICNVIDPQALTAHQGLIRLKCGECQIDVEVMEYHTNHGARLVLNLGSQPGSLSSQAQAVIKSITEVPTERVSR